MIQKNNETNRLEAVCDVCSSGHVELEADSFLDAIRELKEEHGWRMTRKPAIGWVHCCPDCQ